MKKSIARWLDSANLTAKQNELAILRRQVKRLEEDAVYKDEKIVELTIKLAKLRAKHQ